MAAARTTPTRPLALALDVVLGIGSLVLAAGLFFQFLDVYLAFFGETASATDADGTRYLWTAAFAIAAPVVGFVLAAIGKRRGAAIAFVAVGLLCVLSAAVFAVPQGRFTPAPVEHNLPSNYVPCYSGSNDCPGG